MSPVAQSSGMVDTSTQPDHMENTLVNGGGGDGRESSGGSGGSAPSANGHSSQQQQEQQSHSAASKRSPAQKGQVSFTVVTSDIDIGEDGASMSGPEASSGTTTTAAANNTGFQGLPPLPPGRSRWSCSVDTTDAYWFAQDDNTPPSKQQRASFAGPNDLIFGEDDRSSGLSYKDREDRVRQLRERQQIEKQQKLEELKEQAALAQRFREHQENERRRRLEEMRLRDADRRSQVEERKRIIQQAEQDRREAVIRKNTERDHRMESKRRNERSNIVFAFGSSTPRMLDPKDSSTNASYWSSRRATSTTNVHLVDTSITRRASECGEMDLSRKRATSAQGLDRKPEDLRMSSSMYEVFHWDESSSSHQNHPPSTQGTRLTKSRDSSLERKTPPSALIWVRSSTPQPTKSSSLPLSSKDASAPPSSTSSSSSDKTPTNSSQSRFCVWEFGDNFAALGPANQSSGGSGNPAPSSPASTPTSSTCYSRRTASVFTGAGCTIGGEDLMTKSMTAAIPASAARRRTDLIPAMPSLRDTSGTSRSSPRHRSPGMRSGTVTPNSPSRPTSALSQGSNNSSQVSLRSRTSPRKPRPLSIAGTSLSSADKPRDPTTPSRESRPMERKLSIGSTSSTSKPTRAKSAGSDRSAPATPARTPVKAATPKKTPSQVKAESAAKKAVEKSKTTPKTKSTPKTTPSQSPAIESKPLPGTKEDKKKIKEDKTLETKLKVQKSKTESINDDSVTEMQSAAKTNGADSQLEAIVVDNLQPEKDIGAQIEPTSEDSQAQVEPVVEELALETKKLVEESVKPDGPTVEETVSQGKQPSQTSETLAQDEKLKDKLVSEEKLSVPDIQESSNKLTEDDKIGEPEKTLAQKAAEKPVTGYATEEEYKAALAEKRRIAREAKERELELERQKKLDEEERERKEEEEFLKMIAEQKKSEEERLRKAIEEADRNREEEAKRREEEEKQREEAERLEQQKRIETEERLRREEEERQARKSRVAAIMARTRGKGGSNTPTKAEAKTPSDEAKNFGDGEMSISMTDSMMSSIIASESQSEPRTDSQPATSTSDSQASTQPLSDVSLQPASDVISQPSSDTNAAPTSDVSLKSDQHDTDSSSQSQTTEIAVDSKSSVREEVMYSKVEVTSTTENYQVDDLISGMSSIKVEEPHVNGDSPVPMDTTPTQSVDLLGTLSDVHSVNHNGVDNTPPQTTQGTDNLLGSLDPLNSSLTSTTTITPAASNFDQIIDLGQTKLSNEDAVNSNPPSPFIAFEQNLNKKQNQENNSTVPDLLL